MKAAKVTYERALTLDPAVIGPGQAICVPVGAARAVIGPVPPNVAPGLIQGELRDEHDRPLHTTRAGGIPPGLDCVRVAPATRAGLADLLTALDALARYETLHPVPTPRKATA